MSNLLRRWLLPALATAGFAGSLVMFQLILSHHNWRIDLTPERRFTLSDHAGKLLAEVEQDVEVIAFLRSDDHRNSEVEDLLKRIRNASRHLSYSIVDVNRNPAVARQYGVEGYGRLVVKSNGRSQVVGAAREDLLMMAILRATRPEPRVVYLLSGHGEADFDSIDRRTGYSTARTALEHEFYDVEILNLLRGGDVPADAAAVVIADPQRDLLPSEVTRLRAYTARGGGLLVLLNLEPLPELKRFVEAYGVRLDEGVIIDPENRLFAGDHFTVTVPGLSLQHPVSAATRALPLFSQARGVAFAPGRPEVKGIEFLHTAPASWRTADPGVFRTGTANFTSGRDQPGPISVGVSLLIGLGAQSASDAQQLPGHVIVLGDANFADNFFIEYLGNKDLLVNALNWVAGEPGLVGQRPAQRAAGINQFFVSAREGWLAFVLGTIAEPLSVLAIGAVVLWRRKD